MRAVQAHITERQQKEIDRCCQAYYVIIGSIYNVVESAMVDAVELVRRDKRFRHRVKQDFKYALHAYRIWDSKMRETLGDRYTLWLDLSDGVADIIASDLKKLYYAFDAHLMRHHIADHRMIASLETATTMVKFARQTFDVYFDKFRESCGVDLRPWFSGGDMRDIEFRWNRACEPFLRTPSDAPNINFNESRDCELAYKILSDRILSPDTYNLAGRDALTLNEDVCRIYDPDYDTKMQELDRMYQDE